MKSLTFDLKQNFGSFNELLMAYLNLNKAKPLFVVTTLLTIFILNLREVNLLSIESLVIFLMSFSVVLIFYFFLRFVRAMYSWKKLKQVVFYSDYFKLVIDKNTHNIKLSTVERIVIVDDLLLSFLYGKRTFGYKSFTLPFKNRVELDDFLNQIEKMYHGIEVREQKYGKMKE